MYLEDASDLLFGRHQAARIYLTIARLEKASFTTGQVVRLAEEPAPAVSKELKRLVALGLLRQESRRGEYIRDDGDPFWPFIDEVVTRWEPAADKPD